VKPKFNRKPTPTTRQLAQLVGGVAAVLALLAVFLLYTQPDFMRTVADQVWSCF
jgi:hypothetical protein